MSTVAIGIDPKITYPTLDEIKAETEARDLSENAADWFTDGALLPVHGLMPLKTNSPFANRWRQAGYEWAKANAKAPHIARRYLIASHPISKRTVRYAVNDTALQIEVFHWHGDTGKEKCEAVANALNSLDHGKD